MTGTHVGCETTTHQAKDLHREDTKLAKKSVFQLLSLPKLRDFAVKKPDESVSRWW